MASILIADDSALMRQLLERMLCSAGHTLHLAPDGLHALALLDTIPIDLVIADLWMPYLDGWGLAERLRASGPWPRLIILTGDAQAPRWAGHLPAADAVLVKPVRPEDLAATVERLLAPVSAGSPALADAASVAGAARG